MNPETIMQSAEDMRRRLTEKAVQDPEFRASLVADPKGVLRAEYGIELPDEVSLEVHESDENTVHWALPSSAQLTEKQLDQIAAGLCCCGI